MLIGKPDNRGSDGQRAKRIALFVGQVHGARHGLNVCAKFLAHGQGCERIRKRHLAQQVIAGKLDYKQYKVISLVRDPNATNLSGFFYNWPYNPIVFLFNPLNCCKIPDSVV